MHRREFRQVALLRVAEAKCLLDAGYHAGAYYLCGYAVECALKAIIAKEFLRHDLPDKQVVTSVYTHNLANLLGLAGLTAEQRNRAQADPAFLVNWELVRDWSEERRYVAVVPQTVAVAFYNAVTDRAHGVLPWLRRFW